MLWLILLASAVAVVVFIERFLHFHRAQINSTEFLNGVRNVLKRDNVIEALSICDATFGPVARLVKTAILNRDHGRERVREALEEKLISPNSSGAADKTPQQWEAEFAAWIASHKAVTHHVDDSRESIYADRGK